MNGGVCVHLRYSRTHVHIFARMEVCSSAQLVHVLRTIYRELRSSTHNLIYKSVLEDRFLCEKVVTFLL
jgi:hypothetical protein